MPSRKDLFISLCLAAMEALAGFVLLEGLGIVMAGALHAGLIWLLLPVAGVGVAAVYALDASGASGRRGRALTIAAGILVCALPSVLLMHGLWDPLWMTLLLTAFFWRGMGAAHDDHDPLDVQWRFGTGLAVMLLGIILLVARDVHAPGSVWLAISLAGIAYTVTALAALGAARMEQALERSATMPVALAVGAQIVVLLAVGLLALSLFSLDLAGWIGALLSPVWDVVSRTIAFVLTALISPLFFLAGLIHVHPSTRKPAPTPDRGPPRKPLPRPHSGHAPVGGVWLTGAEILIIALIVAGLVYLIWRASSGRERTQRRPRDREKRESLASPADALRALLHWLRHLLGMTPQTVVQAAARARRRVVGPEYPSDPVRRIYAQLLYRAARSGLERGPTRTPSEFQYELQTRWPEGAPDIAAVTAAYILRRYGDRPPTEEEVEILRRHWHRLRDVMRAEAGQSAPTGAN